MMNLKKLVIVIPCYNEMEILPKTIQTMGSLVNDLIIENKISPLSRICFINDGSSDKTWEIISDTVQKDSLFSGICLSRNFGHQNALLAGMYENNADIYVTIDADLQDDPKCIAEMLTHIESGCDIVYGVRSSRETDTFFKKTSAKMYYNLLKYLGVNVVYNSADYRMMTRRAVDILKQFPEKNLFLRAIIPLIGFKYAKVYYERTARTAGTTKYPLKKMIALAWNGVSSFSILPLRLVTILGLLLCFLGFVLICMVIYDWFAKGTVAGWASTITIMAVFGGVQLFSLGIIGEYLAKVFLEVKNRPQYIIDKKIGTNSDNILIIK